MQQIILMTHRKKRELKEKLNKLKSEDFPRNRRIMKETMESGSGMHDNAAYEHALQDEQLLLRRIAELEMVLSNTQIITPPVKADIVCVGCRVKTKNLKNSEISEMVICGFEDTDLDKKWYSYQAPLVKVFLGKQVGDRVSLTFPVTGEQLFEILEISLVNLE